MGTQQAPWAETSASNGAVALPLLLTKLAIPPPAPTLVARPRLTARLEHAAGRLVLAVAPAGSGKSSLLAQWCQQSAPGRVAWLSLDGGENEPNRFLHYLCAALERAVPDAVRPVAACLASPETSSPAAALTLLLNGLTSLDQPVVLVLDDYHEIQAPAVHQLLSLVIEHLPPSLVLILAARREPQLPLARLRASGKLIEVRAEDLRFSAEEAIRFLNDRMGLDLSPDAVMRLTERTEGWILGLQLAALSLQGHPNPDEFISSFTGTHRYLMDYLVEEVLRRHSDGVNAFLQKTVILERLCGPLCDAVIGNRPGPGSGQAMLEQLEAAGLFLIPLDNMRHWYRYHALFAEAIRARPPLPGVEPAAILHERAAAWFESEALVGEAVEHALAGGHWERAARLIEGAWERMFRYDEMRTLDQWVRALPAGLTARRPLLALAVAAAGVNSLRTGDAERALDDAATGRGDDNATPRDYQGKVESLKGFVFRLKGDEERALFYWQEALKHLDPESLVWRSPTLHELGILHVHRGELERAAAVLQEAIALGRRDGHPGALLRASYSYGQLRETQGALSEAARVYEEALEFVRERSAGRTPAAGLALAGLGRIESQRNETSSAMSHLQEAVALTRAAGASHVAWICSFELLQLQTTLGDSAGAEPLFEQLMGVGRMAVDPSIKRLQDLMRVQRRRASSSDLAAWLDAFEDRVDSVGRRDLAAPVLAPPASGWCPPDTPVPGGSCLEILTWARLRLAQRQASLVRTRLEHLLEAILRLGQHGAAVVVRALLAALYWQERRRDRAVAVLEPALALARQEGQVRAFLDVGVALIPVLRYCAEHGIDREGCDALLAALAERFPALEERPGSDASVPLEPLSPRELQVLRLVAAGLSNETIASELFLATGTVKRHLHHIYGKLQATSRISAVARARDLGLL